MSAFEPPEGKHISKRRGGGSNLGSWAPATYQPCCLFPDIGEIVHLADVVTPASEDAPEPSTRSNPVGPLDC